MQKCLKIMKPSTGLAVDMWIVGICEKAVIAREDQTYFGKTFSFVLKLKVFKASILFGKTFSFSSKQKEIQIVELD